MWSNTSHHHHHHKNKKKHHQPSSWRSSCKVSLPKKTVFVFCSLWHCIGRPLYAFSQGRTLFNQDTFIKSQTLPCIRLILGKLKSGALDVMLCQNWSVQNIQSGISHQDIFLRNSFFSSEQCAACGEGEQHKSRRFGKCSDLTSITSRSHFLSKPFQTLSTLSL